MKLRPAQNAAFELGSTLENLRAQGLAPVDPAPILAHINGRFDFPDGLFDHLLMVKANKKLIRAISRPIRLPSQPAIDRAGIDFLRIDMANPRMTTSAAMTWGAHARQNAIDTTAVQCEEFLRRQTVVLHDDQICHCTERGFVFLRHYDHGLGVGFLESTRPGDDHCGRVRSMYPGAYSADVQQTSPFGNPS